MQLHLVIMAKIIIISTHNGHYLGKFEYRNLSLPSLPGPTSITYIRGVDYKGLNESITSAIYHMTQNIECIRR
jgi:hypothetical protein